MIEYLDTYDEAGVHLGKEERNIVHTNALWHKTVHCWLYDKNGNIFFQKRKEEGTLYTTVSGHVLAGETVKEAFGREVEEELGVKVNYEETILVNVVPFKMDKIKKDGTVFKDRAFANVYICEFNNKLDTFNFDANELDGLVRVNALETLNLFKKGLGNISGTIVNLDNSIKEININFQDFLVNEMETAIGKYGEILEKVIEVSK